MNQETTTGLTCSPFSFYCKQFNRSPEEYNSNWSASDLSSRRLINEKTIAILPSLIKTFKDQDEKETGTIKRHNTKPIKSNALRDAIGLQQLHYHIRKRKQNPSAKEKYFHDEKWWTYGSQRKWKERDFPFWSTKTIQRMFDSLESRGVITKGNFNKRKADKTLWFSINYDKLKDLGMHLIDSENSASGLLIDEEPLLLLTELASKIGVHEAIAIQQIHYWLIDSQSEGGAGGYHRDNKYWIKANLDNWQETSFKFLSLNTVKNTFNSLNKKGLITRTNQFNENSFSDKTYSYTINYEALESLYQIDSKERRGKYVLTKNQISPQGNQLSMTLTETTNAPMKDQISPREEPHVTSALPKTYIQSNNKTIRETTKTLIIPNITLENQTFENLRKFLSLKSDKIKYLDNNQIKNWITQIGWQNFKAALDVWFIKPARDVGYLQGIINNWVIEKSNLNDRPGQKELNQLSEFLPQKLALHKNKIKFLHFKNGYYTLSCDEPKHESIQEIAICLNNIGFRCKVVQNPPKLKPKRIQHEFAAPKLHSSNENKQEKPKYTAIEQSPENFEQLLSELKKL